MTKLQFYSLGIVAEDKIKDDYDIHVIPIEKVPTITGDIDERIMISGENVDSEGNITSIQVEKKKYIKAEWLPYGTFNRISPPDVTKGMTVAIYNYAGTDDFYWNTLYFELDLLKQEKVTYMWSNKPQSNPKSNDLLKDTYYLTVDTYDKYIRLHTSKTNGEAVEYDVELDCANGVFTIKDSKDNKIELLSQEDTLNLNLNKQVNINTGDNFNLKTPKNLEIEVDKISVKNSTAELIDILTQLIQANIDEQHLGNMGAPTALMATSQQKYQELLDKLKTFKV